MSGFLLDTNVISETVKPHPNETVLSWLSAQRPSQLFLPALSIGELMRGARKVADASRRSAYERWIKEELLHQFDGRVVAFDQAAAITWGEIMGDGDRTGRVRPAADAQIAALARRYQLVLVTRNTKDFKPMGVEVVDPWSAKTA